MNESKAHPVRLLSHVAVPDHEILAERDVSPERCECEAQLSQIVEMFFADHVVSIEKFPPRHRENGETRESTDPSAHKDPPAVHRALEVQVERHRQIPRQND